jgi:hypothetical protein
MSQLIFNNFVDLQNIVGTPSTGYTVAYDLDGVIKQKDFSGIISPIGGGGGSQSLRQTLIYGNDTGTYSLSLGTSSFLRSGVGNGRLHLGFGNTYSTFLMNGNLTTSTSSVNLTPDFILLSKTTTNQFSNLRLDSGTFSVNVGSSTYSTFIRSDNKSFRVSVSESYLGVPYNVIDILNISDGNDGRIKSQLHLNSRGSTTSNGVFNSVIVGGSNLLATQSNTVYLVNNVNINNKYKLPSTDGTSNQVISTDGSGNLTWTSVSDGSIPPLDKVLEMGATSGSYSIFLGASQSLRTANGYAGIYLDYNNTVDNIFITNNIFELNSYIQLSDDNLIIGATNGLVTTTNGLGLQYTDDYTSSFVTYSLVTKKYVDSIGTGTYTNYKVVYVDSLYGDDGTGQLNRVDLPYATFALANSDLTNSYASNGLVYIKRGLYTESCVLSDNTDYYCEPGVIFSQNGFNDSDGSVTSNIYGYSQFNGTDATLVALDVNNSSNINFEFDSINNLQVGIKLNSSGNINVKGRYIKSQSDYGSVISVEGSGKFNFDIRDGVIGAYDVVYIKSGFSGQFSIKSPNIICDSSLNGSGPVGSSGHALNVHETTSGTVLVNSNLSNISVYSGGNNSAVKVGSGYVTISGNLNGNNEIGLYLTNGDGGNVTVNGDILSDKESIKHLGNKTKLRINNSLVKSNGLGISTYSIHINSASQSGTYLYNTTIYNGLTNSSIIYMQGTTSQLGIYNSLGYSPGTSGNFIYGTPSEFNVGIHNTRSNKDNYLTVNDTFSPSGFIYDNNLYLPNF